MARHSKTKPSADFPRRVTLARPVSLPNGLAGTALPRFWQVGEGEALLLMQIYLYDFAAENQHAGLQ